MKNLKAELTLLRTEYTALLYGGCVDVNAVVCREVVVMLCFAAQRIYNSRFKLCSFCMAGGPYVRYHDGQEAIAPASAFSSSDFTK